MSKESIEWAIERFKKRIDEGNEMIKQGIPMSPLFRAWYNNSLRLLPEYQKYLQIYLPCNDPNKLDFYMKEAST